MQKKDGETTAAEAIAELRKKKKRRLTAAEVAAVLENDPEYMARKAQRERELEERVRAFRREEQHLIQALKDAGEYVESIDDLINTTRAYPKAIPILIEHLQRPYHPKVKEGIVRALTVRSVKGKAWGILLSEFLNAPDRPIADLKGATANALSFLAEKENVEDILKLVQDKRHGDDRNFFVQALARFPEPRVVHVLEELTRDKEVAHEAEKALRKIERRRSRGKPNR